MSRRPNPFPLIRSRSEGQGKMKNVDFGRCALGICLVGLLAGCGGSQPPLGAPGAMPQNAAAATLTSSRGNLLYVSTTPNYHDVYVYTYPGGNFIQTLTGFRDPGGLCSDRAGDVWITDDGVGELSKYVHGGASPVATLSDPDSPNDRSVDTKSGDSPSPTGAAATMTKAVSRSTPTRRSIRSISTSRWRAA